MLLHVAESGCVCTHQMAALFCMKWRHGHHLDYDIISVNQCSPAELHPDSIWNDRIFGKSCRNKNNKNKMRVAIRDQFLI